MENRRKRSPKRYKRKLSPKRGKKRGIDWEEHRATLDELFFRNYDLIKRLVSASKHFLVLLTQAKRGSSNTSFVTFSFTSIRGSQEYNDFWVFLERYEAFHKRHMDKPPKGNWSR